MLLYVGIDWADEHHAVYLTNDQAQPLAQCQLPHTAAGLAQLHQLLAAQQPEPAQVLVALETARGLLVYDLLQAGYQVYAINPKAVNRYKDRHHAAKPKSDPLDAAALAHLLRTDRHCFKPLRPAPQQYRLLERLCADLRKIIDEKTRLSNQLMACLKEYYPQAVNLFAAVDSAICRAFLRAFPDPATLARTKQRQFVSFFQRAHYPKPDRVPQLWAQCQRPALRPDPVLARAGKLRLVSLLDQLDSVCQHQTSYEREIATILVSLPESQVIASLPGLGQRLTPELVAALGPAPPQHEPAQHEPASDEPAPEQAAEQAAAKPVPAPPAVRFAAAQELANLAGCAPITRQSGKWRQVQLRHACHKGLRRTFYDWALSSLLNSRWARAYYDYRKAQGHRHSTILRALGLKWSKILYALWRTGVPYDEQHYIAQLKQHRVSWASAL